MIPNQCLLIPLIPPPCFDDKKLFGKVTFVILRENMTGFCGLVSYSCLGQSRIPRDFFTKKMCGYIAHTLHVLKLLGSVFHA